MIGHLNQFMRVFSGYRPAGTLAGSGSDADEDDQPHGFSEPIRPSVSQLLVNLKHREVIGIMYFIDIYIV